MIHSIQFYILTPIFFFEWSPNLNLNGVYYILIAANYIILYFIVIYVTSKLASWIV